MYRHLRANITNGVRYIGGWSVLKEPLPAGREVCDTHLDTRQPLLLVVLYRYTVGSADWRYERTELGDGGLAGPGGLTPCRLDDSFPSKPQGRPTAPGGLGCDNHDYLVL